MILDKQVPISFLAQNNSRLHIYPQMFTLIQKEMLTQIEPPLTSKLGFGLWFWLPWLPENLQKGKPACFSSEGNFSVEDVHHIQLKCRIQHWKNRRQWELIYGILSIRVDMTCLPYIHANWIKRLFPYNYFL